MRDDSRGIARHHRDSKSIAPTDDGDSQNGETIWEPCGYGELIKEATALAMYVARHRVATVTLIGGSDPCIESELDFLPLATSGDNRLRLDGTPFILPGKGR